MQARGLAFASDFDGTLCVSDWESGVEHITSANIEAVHRFQDSGGLFGICTGRPIYSVQKSLKGVIVPDFYIATTGAQVMGTEGVLLLERDLDRALANELCERYGRLECALVAISENEFAEIGGDTAPWFRSVGTLSELEGRIFGVSLEFGSDEQAAERAAADINERYAGVAEAFQNLGSVDIVREGCSKGAGVHVAKAGLGVRLIAGIGDSYNDLTLLRAADVAYTFPTSPAVVREAADMVVSSVAEALEHFCAQATRPRV